MLIRVNEKMDKLLKKLEKTEDIDVLTACSLLISDEVYKQWKDKEISNENYYNKIYRNTNF